MDDRDALKVVMGPEFQRSNDCLAPGQKPRTADIVRALLHLAKAMQGNKAEMVKTCTRKNDYCYNVTADVNIISKVKMAGCASLKCIVRTSSVKDGKDLEDTNICTEHRTFLGRAEHPKMNAVSLGVMNSRTDEAEVHSKPQPHATESHVLLLLRSEKTVCSMDNASGAHIVFSH
uniref:Uncharacterized protein n=1 Tax=Parascaris equorum TaxID=6256 RepID=A0A914S495_PAREQ